ncbi:MAG TPA: PAS domain S-box protein [Syntrophorhabdales bacterium]|nr:PAS domain S-box protein [Syntrophorhabdales bacterium]
MSQKERREEKLRDNQKDAENLSPEEARALLEDLRLHQTKLEMQNEELKRAQQVIDESREKLSDLYDFAPVAYLTLDRNSMIQEANLTAATLLDVERQQLVGKTFFSFVAQEYRDRYFEHHRKVIEGCQKEACRLQLKSDRGRIFYGRLESVPEEDRSKKVSVRSALIDVTERIQAEEALRRHAELLNLTHDAIIACDLNHRIFFWNRGAEERYGWTSDEVQGKTTGNLLRTVYPRPRQEIEQELLLRGWWEGELTDTSKDGRKIIVASRQALRRDEDGKPIAILEINSDITEQKRIEEQFRQSQKMEAVGTLAGGIAHDFNNVLAAMIGFSELAADEIPADSQAQRHLKRVHEAGLRARELIKQILTFSRKSEGQQKQISLTSLVKETHALLRSSLPTTIQMPLAMTTSDDHVHADPTQIQQVIMNLATNAAHAMRDGGQLTIGVSSVTFPHGSLLPDPDMEPGTYVRLTVKDTGTGMTEEVRRRIFEPFFTTKEQGKGTGMGLAVVYGIVRAHGGAVTVQSEVGQGSIFTVFLARVRKPEAKKETKTISPLPTGTERILFVDDEELLVEMARKVLESLGYRVIVAKHPTDAWNLFLEDPSQFDLVITDQTMPDTTGTTLAQKMLRVRKEMPIILCTGYSETVSAEKAKEAGISEFIMKPVVKRELAETIRRVLDGRKE